MRQRLRMVAMSAASSVVGTSSMHRPSFAALDAAGAAASARQRAISAKLRSCWIIVADLDEVVDLGSLADRYAEATDRTDPRLVRRP